MKISLDHCVIHVGDWDRSIAFYRDVLGAEIVPYGKGAFFRFGPVQLNTHGPGQIGTPRAGVPVEPGGSDLCFAFAGTIAEASAHLAAHGVGIELGPVPRVGARGAGQSLYFRDPDGSLIEFIIYDRAGASA
jgi:catechol 2,3-dioxygenase-like lactoylglutathione lyase family enzyme